MNNKDFLKKNSKSIVIYNPLSNIGHFDSWCSLFVKNLLENGWALIVITRNAAKVLSDLDHAHITDKSKLLVIDQGTDLRMDGKFSVLEIIINKTKILKFLNAIKLNDRRSNQSFFNILVSFSARVFNYLIRKLELFLSKFIPGKLRISFNNPVEFAADINLLTKAFGGCPSFVLNMYLDLYDPSPKLWEKFSDDMHCKWGGIHMDLSRALTDRPYSHSKSLKAIYTINEPVEFYDKTTQAQNLFQWLPDVTDISVPSNPSPVRQDIEKLAAGRKIIFLGGSIGGTKNLYLWSQLFYKLNRREWYFVQIGKIEYPTLSREDLDGLHKLQNEKTENIFISDAYLPEESVFNEVMSISAIIWGLYRGFDRSSNILTKSALLSKPIIVSDRFLMGQRVNAYKIGVAVSEIDADEAKLGIEWLINNPIPLANFEHYADVYSTSALAKKLNESLLQIIS
jgi:hypothetical protein